MATEEGSSNLITYRRLSVFFQSNFPDIDLASESEKDELIARLGASRRFADTHRIVAALSHFSDFTPSQLESIVSAAISNNQIYWIMDDPEIGSFIKRVIVGKERLIDADSLEQLSQYLKQPDDEVPF